ncbi:UNVERIFIED_CONTAM: hypothetical protein DES50_1362 [Williamsia faeni]
MDIEVAQILTMPTRYAGGTQQSQRQRDLPRQNIRPDLPTSDARSTQVASSLSAPTNTDSSVPVTIAIGLEQPAAFARVVLSFWAEQINEADAVSQ